MIVAKLKILPFVTVHLISLRFSTITLWLVVDYKSVNTAVFVMLEFMNCKEFIIKILLVPN